MKKHVYRIIGGYMVICALSTNLIFAQSLDNSFGFTTDDMSMQDIKHVNSGKCDYIRTSSGSDVYLNDNICYTDIYTFAQSEEKNMVESDMGGRTYGLSTTDTSSHTASHTKSMKMYKTGAESSIVSEIISFFMNLFV